jgi:hypothetical protein
MRTEHHPLLSPSLGTQRSITSFHFGPTGGGGWPRKVYIQASLHAGEIPGMLVAHLLRQQFADLEARGCCRRKSCWCRWPTPSAWPSSCITSRRDGLIWPAAKTSTACTANLPRKSFRNCVSN